MEAPFSSLSSDGRRIWPYWWSSSVIPVGQQGDHGLRARRKSGWSGGAGLGFLEGVSMREEGGRMSLYTAHAHSFRILHNAPSSSNLIDPSLRIYTEAPRILEML